MGVGPSMFDDCFDGAAKSGIVAGISFVVVIIIMLAVGIVFSVKVDDGITSLVVVNDSTFDVEYSSYSVVDPQVISKCEVSENRALFTCTDIGLLNELISNQLSRISQSNLIGYILLGIFGGMLLGISVLGGSALAVCIAS